MEKLPAFHLTVPNSLSLLRIVQAFVRESALLAGFPEENLSRFDLIAEEAFVHILRTSFEEGEEGEIRLETTITPLTLRISFYDKGLPFGDKLEDRDSAKNLELAIIRKNCDGVSWINHGKEGKELRLLFNRPQKEITEYELFELSEKPSKPPPSPSISIQRLQKGMGYQVSQLIYKAYSYSYPNEDLYYPEVIEELNRQGKLISIVAVDEGSQRVVGHYALERYHLEPVAEAGQAVVAPEYRGQGILNKMRMLLEKTARDIGLKGIYSRPVTSHTRTQKMNESLGSKVCGITFGLVPKEIFFKKIVSTPLSQRETCFFYFKPLTSEERLISPPRRHKAFITKIYHHLGLPFRVVEGEKGEEEAHISVEYSPSWGIGTIKLEKGNPRALPKLRSAFKELKLSTKAEVIFVHLPMDAGWTQEITSHLEEMGFFFCCIAPFALKGRDALIFQYLDTLIDTSKIQVYGPFARELFEYCRARMKEALS